MPIDITLADLKKRSHGLDIEGYDERFLAFIAEEKAKANPLLSAPHLAQLVRKTKKGISFNILLVAIGAIIALVFGIYQFIYTEPLIGINLYTHFPLISNGSIEIAGSIFMFIGCFYSYTRRHLVLERLVKSQLIEDLKRQHSEKINQPTKLSKKQKRFKQSYKVGKKK